MLFSSVFPLGRSRKAGCNLLLTYSELFWSQVSKPLTQLCEVGQTPLPIPHQAKWPKAGVFDPDYSLPSSPCNGKGHVDTRCYLPYLYHVWDAYSTNWRWSCLYCSRQRHAFIQFAFCLSEIWSRILRIVRDAIVASPYYFASAKVHWTIGYRSDIVLTFCGRRFPVNSDLSFIVNSVPCQACRTVL